MAGCDVEQGLHCEMRDRHSGCLGWDGMAQQPLEMLCCVQWGWSPPGQEGIWGRSIRQVLYHLLWNCDVVVVQNSAC